MNDDLGVLIEELTAAGATDEEIAAILDERLAGQQQPIDQQPMDMVTGQGPIADALVNTSLGKTIVSGLADTMPQMFMGAQAQTASATAQQASEVTDPQAYINKEKTEFQQWVREKKGLKWYQPFNIDDHRDSAEEFIKDQKGLTKKAAKLEGKIQIEKDEAQERLKGVVTDISNISSASDLMSYVGHMAGQGLYQIPASVLSGGTSSVLMESAIVYDTQLDELSKKLGKSREEIIEEGLDDAAAGQAMAGIAAALDMASAGKVLNIFRGAAKKSITKKAINNFFTEATTESIQGNIERGAGASGADTEFELLSKENIHATLNEFVGGGIGGSSVGLVTGADDSGEGPTIIDLVKDAETYAGKDTSTKTGDAAIDDAIDNEYSDIVTALDELDLETGGKATEFEEAHAFSTVNEENEIINEDLTEQQAAALQASTLPSPQEQETLLDDSEATPALDNRNQYLDHESDRQEFESQYTSEELAEMSEIDAFLATPQGREFKKSEERKRLREKEKEDFANAPIPAQEAPIPATRAGGATMTGPDSGAYDFSSNPIEQKKKEKPNEENKSYWIVPTDKSGFSYKVVDKKPRTKDVIEPFESREDAERGIAKLISDNSAFTAEQEAQAKKDRIIKYENQLENIKKDKPNKQLKRLEILNENTLDLPEVNTKVRQQLETLKAVGNEKEFKKQTKKLSLEQKLDLIATRATDNKDKSNVNQIKQLATPNEDESIAFEDFLVVQDSYEASQASNTLLSTEKEEIKSVFKNIAKAYDEKLKSKKEVIAKERVEEAKKTKTDKEVKDRFLTAVAKAVEQKDPTAIDSAIGNYTKWRQDNGLKVLSADEIKKNAAAEFYVDRAHNQIKGDALERRAQENKIKAQKKVDERPPVIKAEDVRAKIFERPALENPVWVVEAQGKKYFLQRLEGLNPSDNAWFLVEKDKDGVWMVVNESGGKPVKDPWLSAHVAGYTKDEAIQNLLKDLGLSDDADTKLLDPKEVGFGTEGFIDGVNKVTFNELFDRISKVYPGGKVLAALKPLVLLADQVSNRIYKNGIEIYIADRFELGKGVYFNDPKTNRHAIVIRKEATGATDTHEIIHFITQAIVNSISLAAKGNSKTLSNKHITEGINKFYGKIEVIHSQARDAYRDKILIIKRKIESGQILDQADINFMTAVTAYLSYRNSDITELTPKTIQQLIDNSYDAVAAKEMYGFATADEMIAETFSNPYFMNIMALLESNQIAATRSIKSFFRDIIDSFKEMLADISKGLGLPNLIPVKNSYLELLTVHMENMENKYLVDEPISFTNSNTTVTPDSPIFKHANDVTKETSALYMIAADGKRYNPTTKELKILLNKISNMWWKRESIQSAEGVMAEMERINARTTKNKFTQVEADYVWKKIQKYRQRLADAKAILANSLQYAQTSRTTEGDFSVEGYHTSLALKRDIDNFAATNLDALSRSDMAEVERGMLELISHGTPTNKAYNIVNKDQAIKSLERLQAAKGKISDRGILKHFANPATYTTILAKYKSPIAQLLFKEVYSGMMVARTNSQKEGNAINNKLMEIANKHSLSHKDYARIQMYGSIFSTFTSPNNTEAYVTEIKENINRVVENANNKLTAYNKKVYKDETKTQIEEQIKIARELYNTLGDNPDIDTRVLTIGQQEMYDAFREFLDKYKEDTKRNTRGMWGADFQEQFNYWPTMALGKVKSGAVKNVDDLIPNKESNNIWDAVTMNRNYGKITGRQSGNTKEKNQPKNYFYDYNILSVAGKFSTPMLFDLYASHELKKLNLLLVGNQGNPVTLNGEDIDAVLPANAIKGLAYQIKSIVGSTVITDKDLNKWIRTGINARNTVATAMMVTVGQFLTQSSSAFPAAIIMSPTGFARALKVLTGFENGVLNFEVMRDFLDKQGLSIQLRDVLFERFQTLDDIQKSGLARGFSNVRTTMERTASAALRSSDKFAARLVWFSAYFEAGGTLENPSKDAVLQAERAVGLLQNMSDVTFSAPIFRSADGPSRILVHMFYAFKSFALNSALNTYNSAYYSFSSGEARKVFAANIAMAAAYQAVGIYAIRPFYDMIADAIMGEDDDDEEKSYTKGEQVAWNMFWDLGVGQISPAVVDGLFRLGLSNFLAIKANANAEPYDPFLDNPIYSPATLDKALAETSGAYGDIAIAATDIIGAIGIKTFEAMGYMEEMDELDNELLFVRMMYDMALLNKFVPMRGDVQKILRNYERKLKAQKRAQSATASPAGAEDVGTEFELPEYEIDYNTSDPSELPALEYEY